MGRSGPDGREYLSLVPAWRTDEPRAIARTRMFTLRQHRAVSPRSAWSGEFVYLDAPDWAHVIAFTREGEVVMIEQFRHGRGQVTLELPGGVIDAREFPAEACERELREETGYRGDAVEIIGAMDSNPAVMNNRTFVGLVRNARRHDVQRLDEMEDIAVRLVPGGDVGRLIRTGVITHSLVIAAFQMLHVRAG